MVHVRSTASRIISVDLAANDVVAAKLFSVVDHRRLTTLRVDSVCFRLNAIVRRCVQQVTNSSFKTYVLNVPGALARCEGVIQY